MAKRLQALPQEMNIDIDKRMFNDAYYPHLYTVHNYEVYYGGTGSGKCFAKDTNVVMYSGELKKIQDVVVGDLVMGIDSKPRTVMSLSHGEDMLYKVSQNKGVDYIVNGNHILCLKKSISCGKTENRKRRYPDYADEIEISVNDWLLKSEKWKKSFYGYRNEVEFNQKGISVEPYYLGAWLGDGNSNAAIVTTMDEEVKNYIYEYAERLQQEVTIVGEKGLAISYRIKGTHHPEYIKNEWAKFIAEKRLHGNKMSLSKICEKLGFSRKNIILWNKEERFLNSVEECAINKEKFNPDVITKYLERVDILSMLKELGVINNKHIPNNYLYNSREVRLNLLAGLIDTDGSMSGNCYEITQKNKRLAEQIHYLASSLGLRCSISECEKTCTNNGAAGTYYRLNISGNTHIIPVKIERKKITNFNKAVNPMITGIKIEPIGVGEYYGFGIDGDHKFFLQDFTVTHNSYFVSQKLALQLSLMPGRNLVCLRKQKTDCIDSCFSDIKGALSEFKLLQYWEVKENPNHVMYNRVNGNIIAFGGVDNIEDIKSIKFYNKVTDKRANLTDVWYEEVNAEESVATIDELDRRIRDFKLKNRIILSFNPVSRAHWLYEYVTNTLKVDGVDSLVLKTTYLDNAHYPQEKKKMLERYRFTSPYDYQVYTLGNWGTMGTSIFDANKIQTKLNELAGKKFNQYYFQYTKNINGIPNKDSYRILPIVDGDITIFKEPESKHPYVLGIDTAGEGSDYYAGHVIDNITGEQVAVFHSQAKPDECVWQLLGLALYYNEALVVPEINFDTWIVKAFQMADYTEIYRRVSKADKTHIRREDKYGWRTDLQTRPMMLTDMVYWATDNTNLINDEKTLNEMLTFTRQDRKLKGIWMGAEAGTHDDLVMAFAITLQGKEQQSCELVPDKKKLTGFWTKEEIEMALENGDIDIMQAREYKETVGYYCEGN